uniref:Ig-like domain-containing protein n=1 Tax=Cyprinus carpio TaxID=7962 RepID=A0A8C1ZXC3_CYPCA
MHSILFLGFLVKGPSGPLIVPLGSSVVLPCYVDDPLPLKGLKVIWVRTDANTLVHVFQDYESRPDAQYQDYHDRAHFFTDKIKHGNFSLRLENVRAEDKGFYRCKVYTEQESDETLIQIKSVEHLMVSGSNHPVSAYVGEDITLNCFADSHIPPEEIDEVSWRKTDKNEIIQVLVFEKNKIIPADERYRHRVDFFTAEIPKGNFSLRLKSVRTEDKGVYMCQVFAGNFSANTTAVLEQLGFLSETVACCAHYFLRPLLLLWAAPHSKHFPGSRETVVHCIIHLQYSLFTNVVHSVLFKSFWEKSLRYEESDKVLITILFGIMILICIVNIVFLLAELITYKDVRIHVVLDLVSDIGHDVLPPLQLIFLFYAFGAARRALFVLGVFPLFLTLTRYDWNKACVEKLQCSPLFRRAAWLSFMITVNAIMVYSYLIALEKEKDCVGWVCVAAFLQGLWGIVVLKHSFDDLDLPFRRVVYLIGSVGVVLVNSVALMTELIMKVVDGERAMEDLRKVVFSSECLFVSSVLLLIIFEPYIKKFQQHFQREAAGTPHNLSNQNQAAEEMCELSPLRETEEQEDERNREMQPDSELQQSLQ